LQKLAFIQTGKQAEQMAAESAQSEAEKLQQRFTESADALISTLSKQGKELKALQAKVEAAQRDKPSAG
jgi:hypothetical protein